MVETITRPALVGHTIDDNPAILIPNRLMEVVDNPEDIFATSSIKEMGRLNQEYPVLQVLIGQKEFFDVATTTQEDPLSCWNRLLNFDRARAIAADEFSEYDKLLILLRLHPFSLKSRGAFIDLYVESKQIHGFGIGRAFFDNLATQLNASNYHFMCGQNLPENEEFYWKTGWERFDKNREGIDLGIINTIRYI